MLSYKKSIAIFFILYIVPIIVIGYFVTRRIQARQVITQLFLQNQIDVDRKILTQHGILRDVQPKLRQAIAPKATAAERGTLLGDIKDDQDNFRKFWQKYEANYSGGSRPFLKSILAETQELNLLEEEDAKVKTIQVQADAYFNKILSHPVFRGAGNLSAEENFELLYEVNEFRNTVFGTLNDLADIRYIFAQRTVFFISSENTAQQGTFNTIFIAIILSIFAVAIVEYFILLRPLGDIMLFLSDLSAGKRGQRLYFSSPISEIKKSEDIINDFVDKAEEHEKGDHHEK